MLAIDYRGWGNSEGKARVISPVNLGGGMEKDEKRHAIVKNATVWIKRTELNAKDQQEDYRNAISFIQGEPGVNPDLIGVWGSSYAGGNSLAVAGQDARGPTAEEVGVREQHAADAERAHHRGVAGQQHADVHTTLAQREGEGAADVG